MAGNRRTDRSTGRRRLDREQVVEAAEAIVDELGIDLLTMAALADRVGTKGPSLYNHVATLDDLRSEIQQRTMRLLGRELVGAVMGRSGHDAFVTMAHAHRAFVLQHPNRYEAATRPPIDRDALAVAADDASQALQAIVRSYGVAPDDLYLGMLSVFAALHGALALECSGYFPTDLVDYAEVYETVLVGAERQLAALAAKHAA